MTPLEEWYDDYDRERAELIKWNPTPEGWFVITGYHFRIHKGWPDEMIRALLDLKLMGFDGTLGEEILKGNGLAVWDHLKMREAPHVVPE